MGNLRSKLHLGWQGGQRLSLLHSTSPQECQAASQTPTLPAGLVSDLEPAKPPAPSSRHTSLGTLPDKLLVRIVSFCDFGDFFRLRRCSKKLHHTFAKPAVIEQILLQLMDRSFTNGTPSTPPRDVLLQAVKAQLDNELRDQDFRRDVFLCLAVTIPQGQRTRLKNILHSLLARAQIRGSCRDPDPAEDPQDPQNPHDLVLPNDLAMAADLERSIGTVSTLLVMGYWDMCDLPVGRQLLTLNHWSIKSNLWSERHLLKHKEISLQIALSLVFAFVQPTSWQGVPSAPPEYQSLVQRVKAEYRGLVNTSSSQSFLLSWEGLQARSLQLAGSIAYMLKAGGFEDVPRADLLPLRRGPPPASPASTAPCPKIPLLENFSKNGVRPQAKSWQEWYTSRVRDLVNTIEDEAWYGYYLYTLEDTDSFGPVGAQDPAMENIHFKLGSGAPLSSAQSQTSAATPSTLAGLPVRLPLEARGCKDGVIEFDFEGTIRPNTGMVSLRKSYRGAHCWDYEGVMTPVGIVGEWGCKDTAYYGYFWLWKRSWMVENAVQKTHAYS